LGNWNISLNMAGPSCGESVSAVMLSAKLGAVASQPCDGCHARFTRTEWY
jgi:hypothetical protein